MSQNGYYYPLGPFDAFLHERQSGQNMTEQESEKILFRSDKKKKLYLGGSQNATLKRFPADESMLDERQYDRELEEIFQEISAKKQLIAEHKQELEYALSELNELYDLRENRLQMRQQMADKSNNGLFSSCETKDGRKKTQLSADYTPEQFVQDKLEFIGVPTDFIYKQLDEFKIFYIEKQDKRNNWNHTFYMWVNKNWTRDKHKEAITEHFSPDKTSLEELTSEKIDAKFCQKEMKRFILYWQEQKATFTPKLWQERFKQWMRRAWQRNMANEDNSRPSYPTTKEFTDTERADKYQFSFEEEQC